MHIVNAFRLSVSSLTRVRRKDYRSIHAPGILKHTSVTVIPVPCPTRCSGPLDSLV